MCDNPRAMSSQRTHPYSGVLQQLSAAEEANLGTLLVDGKEVRGVPKKLARQFRKIQLEGYDKDAHTVTMAVSSSTPVERYYGSEVLSHAKGAIRTNRLDGGLALLFNHDMDKHLGRSLSFELGDPLHVTSRFGGNPLAVEKEGDVAADILTDVSIGYLVHEWEITEDKNGVRTYLAVDWEPYEISLVTVPADPTVGVGRDMKDGEPIKVRSFRSAKQEAEDSDDDDEGEGDPEEDDENDTGSASSRSTNPAQTRTEVMAKETETPGTGAAVTAGVDHVAVERQRVAQLDTFRTLNPKAYTEEQYRSDVAKGVSPADAGTAIQARVIADNQRTDIPSLSEELFSDMSEREAGRYSLRNAYIAAYRQLHPSAFPGKEYDTGFEREVSVALVKKAEERGVSDFAGGIVVPSAGSRSWAGGAQKRAVTVGTTGASTVPTILEATPIELLRARTLVLALGAQMMTGVKGGNLRIPRQSGAASSNWLAESAASSDSDLTFDYIGFVAHRLQITNAVTMDMMAQSPIAIDSVMANDRLRVLALALDYACLNGSGTGNVPLGLLNQTGIATTLAGATRASNGTVTAGAGGVPPTFVDLNIMEALIANANAEIGTMGWAFRPKMRAALRSIPKLPGSQVSGFIMPDSKPNPSGVQEGPLGYDSIASTNVPTGYTANSVSGLDAIILGVWDQMLIADWDVSELIVDPYTQANSAIININEFSYYDTNVRHIPAFAACTSALAS